ncbi:helix-turn-helix domain-containing protein [Nocardiopsis halophila]|uniref:helix-turn-helix domain-containing protein n=1 Tax=Nocardiopsis halophila TaxID=141692 RepID=UPI000344BC2F|nr:helix-turn-helix transcriptional regulator [Nocardiopsis halophila]
MRRRRLSAVLRDLRHTSGKTLEEAAKELEWSRGRLAHMESNKWTRPDLGNIRQLLDLYEVTDESQREAILTLARQSRQRGWWTKYSDVFGSDTYIGFESEASVISTYQPIVVPGLLQTEAYAAESVRSALVSPIDEGQRVIDARMARQEILTQDDPPALWVVIDESVLHRIPQTGGVAREQVQRLIDVARDPYNGITLQVLPYSTGLHPGISGPFVMLDFPGEADPTMVYLETRLSSLFLEEPDEVAEYKLIFDHLKVAARSQGESIGLMEDLMAELE